MNWIDLALLVLVAAVTAVGAQRKLGGLLLGLAALLLLRPFLVLAEFSSVLAMLLALLAGLAAGFGGRLLSQRVKTDAGVGGMLGGAGGFLLGCLLLLTVVTSLPVERNINNQIVYPPRQLPLPFETVVPQSQLMKLGRGILLYPLLARADPANASAVLEGLHQFLVVKEPWGGG